MDIIKAANLGLRFVLEIAALIAVGRWGFQTGESGLLRWLLGLGAPLLVAAIWATFGSPAAPYRLDDPWRLGLELLVFGAGVAALFLTGRTRLGWVFAGVVVANTLLMLIWAQR